MPGYIIHLSEAEMILKALQKKGFSLDEKWKNLFRLGSLLPDSKRKREKVTSHFWDRDTLDHLAIPPVLETFERLYQDEICGPVMLGYWAHLHLDADYVNRFWPSVMRFTDEEGKEQVKKEKIRYVELLEKNRKILLEDFFSSEYYYGDFDRTNTLFYKRYQVQIPQYEEGLICPVKEVNISDLTGVLDELNEMLLREEIQEGLKVFQLQDLQRFLEETAQKAAEKIWTEYRLELEEERKG